jgi:hypothetical protein
MMEMLKIAFWFNPFIYLLKNDLTLVHEHEADSKCRKFLGKKAYTEMLLNKTFGTAGVPFSHAFNNVSHLKSRIMMMNKGNQNNFRQVGGSIATFLVLMVVVVACTQDNPSDLKEAKELPIEFQINEDSSAEPIQLDINEKEKTITILSGDQKGQVFNYVKTEAGHLMMSNGEVITIEEENIRTEQEAINYSQVDQPPLPVNIARTSLSIPEQRLIFQRFVSKTLSDNTQIKKFINDVLPQLAVVFDDMVETGQIKIRMQFRVDADGIVQDVKARSEISQAEKLTIKAIERFPQFQPALNNGQPVSVMYSLPIILEIPGGSKALQEKRQRNQQRSDSIFDKMQKQLP